MKRILAGVSALVATVVLAACSGGATGGAPLAGGSVGPAVASAVPTPSTTAPSTSETPTPTSSSAKPIPATSKTTTPKPQPKTDPGVPCAATVAACVDLSAHKAWLIEGGKVVYGPVPMLPGRKGYETPTGTFHVYSKEKMHLSTEFDNAPMPNSVFFYPGDAFHTGSLSVYSHGCIHLSATASQKFFTTLSVGDKVQVVP